LIFITIKFIFLSQGEVRLELPPLFEISKIVRSNKDMIEQAESLVYKWNGEIREALERELKKVKLSKNFQPIIFFFRHHKHQDHSVKLIGGVNVTSP
jgi:hypothetical protein